MNSSIMKYSKNPQYNLKKFYFIYKTKQSENIEKYYNKFQTYK